MQGGQLARKKAAAAATTAWGSRRRSRRRCRLGHEKLLERQLHLHLVVRSREVQSRLVQPLLQLQRLPQPLLQRSAVKGVKSGCRMSPVAAASEPLPRQGVAAEAAAVAAAEAAAPVVAALAEAAALVVGREGGQPRKGAAAVPPVLPKALRIAMLETAPHASVLS